MEKLLLMAVIGIGCYGFTFALQACNSKEVNTTSFSETPKQILNYDDTASLMDIEGSFVAGYPIRFKIAEEVFISKKYTIDFGNGISQRLSDHAFTFAYHQEGDYQIQIKAGAKTMFSKKIQIKASKDWNQQLVMR